MRNIQGLPAVAVLALTLGSTAALAQSAVPDEAVQPNGTVTQNLALTTGQKRAIYNAVTQHGVRPRTDQISPAVGAPVPPLVELIDLPDQARADNPSAAFLKYAMVEPPRIDI